MISLTIILSVVLTGLILALGVTAGEHAAMGGAIPKMDVSFYVAEAGAQHAAWKFKHDNAWRATAAAPFTGSMTVDGTVWNYSATCLGQVGDASLAWKFDEGTGATTADYSGNNNNGIFHGQVAWSSAGRSGNCVSLAGVDGYIDCGNNASSNITGDMTFSAWVKMNSGYYDQKIGGNQNGSFGGYKLCIYNSKAEFEVRDSGNVPRLDRDVAGGTILTMGTWYHIVGEYSASGHWVKTYVNGVFDRQLTGLPANALGSTTGNFVMGKEPWASLYFFNGYIDDVRIWTRTLSDAEVKSLYDTSVDIRCVATDAAGRVSNVTAYTAAIPTPPPPAVPAITAGKSLTVTNLTINGGLSVDGDVTCPTGSSTVSADLNYTSGAAPAARLVVTGKTSKVSSISFPDIDYAYLQTQATTWGKVVAGDSTGQTFTFNSLGGNKVIWIQGDLTDPVVTIGGQYAAGGTFLVDGKVTFTAASTTLGSSGYPVNIITKGDVRQTGASLTLVGGIYTTKKFKHKDCSIVGPVVVKDDIENTATGTCTFTTSTTPWFDNRALPQAATLPLYSINHVGNGP